VNFSQWKSTVSLVLHEFVYVVNSIYRGLISWLEGLAMILVMDEFKQWCGFPSVQGAIDGTHISIFKPQGGFASY
jgi:hypothetical protein